MIVYVFLVKRPQDRDPWPCVYTDLTLAERARGRISDVVSVEVGERKTRFTILEMTEVNPQRGIAMASKAKPVRPRRGTDVVWPKGVEEMYDISAPTRWRWEKQGILPKRDVSIGKKTGWRPETLSADASIKVPA